MFSHGNSKWHIGQTWLVPKTVPQGSGDESFSICELELDILFFGLLYLLSQWEAYLLVVSSKYI